MRMISTPTAVLFDGPCMFLTCLDDGPHGHDVCPTCEAIKFGNAFCRTCLAHQAVNGSALAAELLRRWAQ